MSLLHSGGSNYIGVSDIAAAVAWYIEKLGLQKIKAEMNDCPGCVVLGFDKDVYAVTIGPVVPSDAIDELTHSLFTNHIDKAQKWLSSRGVNVGEIQKDRQGTRFFEIRDPENNVIEITEEP